MKISFILFSIAFIFSSISIDTKVQVIGNPNYIHLQNENGAWWFVDHKKNKFITTGMNHIDERKILFNEVNKGWMEERFGEDIKMSPWNNLNKRSKNIGAFADMVVEHHKDNGFNTIPFHSYAVPYEKYEERKIYYIAKIKVQSITLMHMNRNKGARFPDVFSQEFYTKLDDLTRKICVPLKKAKYLLGYTFFDMPDLKSIRPWQRRKFPDKGQVYPFVQDIRSLPATAAGKKVWMDVLKENHASASEAAAVYAISGVQTWDDLANVTEWPPQPANEEKVLEDAEIMFTALANQWYKLHHDLIKKYDPNHLIIGDKHDVGYDKQVHMIPDGVLEAIGKYCDVLMIQSYSFYTEQHSQMLRQLHEGCGLPIINGDHAYAYKTEKQTKIKGLEMDSFEAVGKEYQKYLRRTVEDHPYMLGWWYCGYIEQWAPAGSHLGQQCGFFSPFGEPNEELLGYVREANRNAVKWRQDKITTQ